MAVNELDGEYQGQPVLFLEYDVDDPDYSTRETRFWAAHSGGSVTLPLIAVDSGHQISSGSLDFRKVYREMVNSALARPAEADIEATWWREEDQVVVSVAVTNRSDSTIGHMDLATVHAIVYENAEIKLTNHYVRAIADEQLGEVFPGATSSYTLMSEKLTGVDWDKLAVAVIVDHRPDSKSYAYDTLQAAPATKIDSPFAVSTNSVLLLSDTGGERPGTASRQLLQITGSPGLTWTAAVTVPWLTVTPMTGTVNAQVQIAAEPDQLADGWQQTTVTFAASKQYQQPVTVRVYRGPLSFVYLPGVQK